MVQSESFAKFASLDFFLPLHFASMLITSSFSHRRSHLSFYGSKIRDRYLCHIFTSSTLHMSVSFVVVSSYWHSLHIVMLGSLTIVLQILSGYALLFLHFLVVVGLLNWHGWWIFIVVLIRIICAFPQMTYVFFLTSYSFRQEKMFISMQHAFWYIPLHFSFNWNEK